VAAANVPCPPSREGADRAGVKVWLYRGWSHTLARLAWFLGSNNAVLRGVFMGQTRTEAVRAHAEWNDARQRDGHPALMLVGVPRFDAALLCSEIEQLSPATLAELCGSDDGEDVDAYSVSWRAWVGELGEGHRWDSWQECHDDFVAHLEGVVLTLFAP
jgi:hypothetical protein